MLSIYLYDDTTTLLRALVGTFRVECIIVAGRTFLYRSMLYSPFLHNPQKLTAYTRVGTFLGASRMTRVQNMPSIIRRPPFFVEASWVNHLLRTTTRYSNASYEKVYVMQRK